MAIEIVRFNKRYYILPGNSRELRGLSSDILVGFHPWADGYKEWLTGIRGKYSAREYSMDTRIFEIDEHVEPEYELADDYLELPSELPRWTPHGEEHCYMVDLDRQVLTIDFRAQWDLRHIPLDINRWLKNTAQSSHLSSLEPITNVYQRWPMDSLDSKMRAASQEIGRVFRIVDPQTDIRGARELFLAHVMDEVLLQYNEEIIQFGPDWEPDSFPFRELASSLVSIASGQVDFFSFPKRHCHPSYCHKSNCTDRHLQDQSGWLDRSWVGHHTPLLEFGSMAHRPRDNPGVSPEATRYWLGHALVSLSAVIDCDAITAAINWGIEQRRTSFCFVILSLSTAALGEVSFISDVPGEHSVTVSKPFYLTCLHNGNCMATQPRVRQEAEHLTDIQTGDDNHMLKPDFAGPISDLCGCLTGVLALINFFESASTRYIPLGSTCVLPRELCDSILDLVDYDTWKSCLSVSKRFRSACLSRFRIDERTRIIRDPSVRRCASSDTLGLSFHFQDIQTDETMPFVEESSYAWANGHNWFPVIGSSRKALIFDTIIQFRPASEEDEPIVETDNEMDESEE